MSQWVLSFTVSYLPIIMMLQQFSTVFKKQIFLRDKIL